MLVNKTTRDINLRGMQAQQMTVKVDGALFDQTVKRLYTDPFAAVVRETVFGNAADAHIQVWRETGEYPSRPIEVTFPHILLGTQEFTCRDYGKGMTREFLVDTYSNLLSSTRNQDVAGDEAVHYSGGFGKGRMAILSAAESFVVESIADTDKGRFKNSRICIMNEDGIPIFVDILVDVPTDEPTGTKITVKSDKMEELKDKFDFYNTVYHISTPHRHPDGTPAIITNQPLLAYKLMYEEPYPVYAIYTPRNMFHHMMVAAHNGIAYKTRVLGGRSYYDRTQETYLTLEPIDSLSITDNREQTTANVSRYSPQLAAEYVYNNTTFKTYKEILGFERQLYVPPPNSILKKYIDHPAFNVMHGRIYKYNGTKSVGQIMLVYKDDDKPYQNHIKQWRDECYPNMYDKRTHPVVYIDCKKTYDFLKDACAQAATMDELRQKYPVTKSVRKKYQTRKGGDVRVEVRDTKASSTSRCRRGDADVYVTDEQDLRDYVYYKAFMKNLPDYKIAVAPKQQMRWFKENLKELSLDIDFAGWYNSLPAKQKRDIIIKHMLYNTFNNYNYYNYNNYSYANQWKAEYILEQTLSSDAPTLPLDPRLSGKLPLKQDTETFKDKLDRCIHKLNKMKLISLVRGVHDLKIYTDEMDLNLSDLLLKS